MAASAVTRGSKQGGRGWEIRLGGISPRLSAGLDFIAFLEEKHGLKEAASDQLKSAQTPAMGNIWNNPEDEVWNDA